MVTVRLPAMLRQGGPDTLSIAEPVATVAGLVEILEARVPGFRDKLDDAVLNFAVNDHLMLHDVMRQPLHDGDRVEIVPTIAGGSLSTPTAETQSDSSSCTDQRSGDSRKQQFRFCVSAVGFDTDPAK